MAAPDEKKLEIEAVKKSPSSQDVSFAKKTGSWLSKHYLSLINLILAIYVFLPLFAPVFMKLGKPEQANVIYRLYRPLCHQLAYRSFFLFGDQPVYPREIAGIGNLRSYEEVTAYDGDDVYAAMDFIGNEALGYKTALCQRDIAIYGSLLLFGLFFAISGKKIKPLPWFVWILLGLVPIGLDGMSQLVSQLELSFLPWLNIRESTPFLRVLTGFLFGWFTGWFGFPSIEEVVPTNKETTEQISW